MEDITRGDARRRRLNAELNHRIKNIFALVQSIVMPTGVQVTSVAEYSAILEGRLRALAFAHDQSMSVNRGGDLKSLVEWEASIHNYGDAVERVEITGPSLGLDERGFGAMALVLHEMTTNAAKYGALSVRAGRLGISWLIAPNGDCVIEWVERDGPRVAAPGQLGFGSRLIRETIDYDLGGSIEIDYAETGLRARIWIPSRYLRVSSDAMAADSVLFPDDSPLEGLDVLLVEDQALIAMDTEDVLYTLGARRVRSCPGADNALAAIAKTAPDCAVLDINLGSRTSLIVADSLTTQGIPFIFVTGYSDSMMTPERFLDVPVVSKPVNQQALVKQLIAVRAARSGHNK